MLAFKYQLHLAIVFSSWYTKTWNVIYIFGTSTRRNKAFKTDIRKSSKMKASKSFVKEKISSSSCLMLLFGSIHERNVLFFYLKRPLISTWQLLELQGEIKLFRNIRTPRCLFDFRFKNCNKLRKNTFVGFVLELQINVYFFNTAC